MQGAYPKSLNSVARKFSVVWTRE